MKPQSPPAAPQQSHEPDSTPLKTDIVGNIPMHHAQAAPAPVHDNDNLDKIMQDVGHELKKEDKKPSGHHFFSKKPKTEVILHAQPVQREAQTNAPPQAAPAHQLPAAKPQAKPKSENKAPVLIIVVTLLVTVILIALAVSVY
ncbi:hypothetical protein KW803_02780 [Candidatus Saccharibacteria bacterium]|nr:hypothetical protein [Candidatus Saccharibacteria bacterium]